MSTTSSIREQEKDDEKLAADLEKRKNNRKATESVRKKGEAIEAQRQKALEELAKAEQDQEEIENKLANATAFLNMDDVATDKREKLEFLLKAINAVEMIRAKRKTRHDAMYQLTSSISKKEYGDMILEDEDAHNSMVGATVELLAEVDLEGTLPTIHQIQTASETRLQELAPWLNADCLQPPQEPKRKTAKKKNNGCACRSAQNSRCAGKKHKCPCAEAGVPCRTSCRCGADFCYNPTGHDGASSIASTIPMHYQYDNTSGSSEWLPGDD